MGFSVAVASAIFFSAALIFSTIIYDTLDQSLQDLQDSEDDRYEMVNDKFDTRIVINDIITENNEVRIEASNTGGSIITVESNGQFLLDVLVNGSLVTDMITGYMVMSTGSSFWGPGEDITIYLRFVKLGDETSVGLVTPQGERSDYMYYEPIRAHFVIEGFRTPYSLEEDTVYELVATPPPGGREDIRYYWNFGDGSSGYGVSTEHSYSQPGTYESSLMITSGSGESAEFSVQVGITDTTAPTAVIQGYSIVDEETQIDFKGVTWDNVGVIRWDWDFGDGSTGSGSDVQHSYGKPNLYTILLTVSDEEGNSATTAHQIMVTDNTHPTCDAGDDISSRVGDTVYFDGSGSNDPDDGRIITYTWDFDDGHFGSGEYTSHVYSEPGEYYVMLRVMDLEGHISTDNISVTINESRGE